MASQSFVVPGSGYTVAKIKMEEIPSQLQKLCIKIHSIGFCHLPSLPLEWVTSSKQRLQLQYNNSRLQTFTWIYFSVNNLLIAFILFYSSASNFLQGTVASGSGSDIAKVAMQLMTAFMASLTVFLTVLVYLSPESVSGFNELIRWSWPKSKSDFQRKNGQKISLFDVCLLQWIALLGPFPVLVIILSIYFRIDALSVLLGQSKTFSVGWLPFRILFFLGFCQSGQVIGMIVNCLVIFFTGLEKAFGSPTRFWNFQSRIRFYRKVAILVLKCRGFLDSSMTILISTCFWLIISFLCLAIKAGERNLSPVMRLVFTGSGLTSFTFYFGFLALLSKIVRNGKRVLNELRRKSRKSKKCRDLVSAIHRDALALTPIQFYYKPFFAINDRFVIDVANNFIDKFFLALLLFN